MVWTLGFLGVVYVVSAALVLGGLFIYYAVRLWREATALAARRLFLLLDALPGAAVRRDGGGPPGLAVRRSGRPAVGSRQSDRASLPLGEGRGEGRFAGRRWRLLALVAVLALLVACKPSSSLPVLFQAPEWTLTDQSGRPFASSSLNGHVVLADFIYTTCTDVCPLLSGSFSDVRNQLRQAKLLGDKAVLVSFSVDPDHDTRISSTSTAGASGPSRPSGASSLATVTRSRMCCCSGSSSGDRRSAPSARTAALSSSTPAALP